MKRKIQDIRDLTTGKELIADNWLSSLNEPDQFELRRKLKIDYKKNSSSIVCAVCNSPVYLAGNIKQEHYFKHWKELGNCPIKTQGRFSQREIDRMKFNGVKESKPHIEIKEHLYTYLSNSAACSGVEKEKVVKATDISGWWKKPDLSLSYNNQKTVIEIQLSTTYLDVIVERDTFYEQNQIYILWVFDEKEISRFRFSEKDIFYDNKRNAFLVTSESRKISQERNELYFICYYQQPKIINESLQDIWASEFVSFSELKFDKENFKIYYHDYNSALSKLQKEILAITANEFEKYWLERDLINPDLAKEKDLYFIKKFGADLIKKDKFERKIINILNALYSVKHGRIIGFNFQNLVSLSNFILHERPEFSRAYLWALEIYNRRKEVENADSFKNKVKKYKIEKPLQDNELNTFFGVLFPELARKIY